jgi:hypothetical protein
VTGASLGSRTGDVIVAISNLSVSWNEQFSYQVNPDFKSDVVTIFAVLNKRVLLLTGFKLLCL